MIRKVYIVITVSKFNGDQRIESAFDSQDKAVEFARGLRKNLGDSLVALWQEVEVE